MVHCWLKPWALTRSPPPVPSQGQHIRAPRAAEARCAAAWYSSQRAGRIVGAVESARLARVMLRGRAKRGKKGCTEKWMWLRYKHILARTLATIRLLPNRDLVIYSRGAAAYSITCPASSRSLGAKSCRKRGLYCIALYLKDGC